MKISQMISRTTNLLSLLAVVLLSMSPSIASAEKNALLDLPKLGDTTDSSNTIPLTLTDKPAPAQPGAFCSCSAEVSEPTNIRKFEIYHGFFYFPRPRVEQDREQCVDDARLCKEIHGGPYHLAVIHHAIGTNSLDYGDLGKHLATHGFATFVSDTNSDVTAAGDGLAYIYSKIGGALTDNIALIGHSQGGHLSLSEGDYINKLPVNKNLAAMVLMAPKVNADETHTLAGVTPALLGLHWTKDNDAATYGQFVPPSRSVFKAYDDANVNYKEFVYFDLAGHEQQNHEGVVAYTTAFLHRYLAGRTIYDRFLKYQEVPTGLMGSSRPIAHQHTEMESLVVANFESDPQLYSDIIENGISAVVWPINWSWHLDSYSPHDTRVVKFSVLDPALDSAIEFPFTSAQTLVGYRHFSFRITQLYDPVEAPEGENRSFLVALCSEEECWSVDLADYGGIDFPIVVHDLSLTQNLMADDATKNAMRSILIRLSDFGIPNDVLISRVRFDFSVGNAAGGDFIVDDLEFFK